VASEWRAELNIARLRGYEIEIESEWLLIWGFVASLLVGVGMYREGKWMYRCERRERREQRWL